MTTVDPKFEPGSVLAGKYRVESVLGEQRRDGRVISEVLVLGRAGPGA